MDIQEFTKNFLCIKLDDTEKQILKEFDSIKLPTDDEMYGFLKPNYNQEQLKNIEKYYSEIIGTNVSIKTDSHSPVTNKI